MVRTVASLGSAAKGVVEARLREIAERELDPRSPKAADGHILVAECDVKLGQFEGAERGFQTALDILREAYGADALELAHVYRWLEHSCRERGALEEAAHWQRQERGILDRYLPTR